MNALIVDLESTGVDTNTARITELGAKLVDKDWKELFSFEQLVKEPGAEPLTDEIINLTGITQKDLDISGVPLKDALGGLFGIVKDLNLQFMIAFNRDYDENLLKAEISRQSLGMTVEGNYFSQIPWLCAMKDVEANYKFKCWKLSHLALDHGIPIDPSQLHRALADVELTRKLLQKTGVTVDEMWAFQTMPWSYLRAVIPAPWEDGGKGKDDATKLGYGWEKCKGTDAPKFAKAWVKRVKEKYVDEEIAKAPFLVRHIKDIV